jgi:transcriptional regulator with XRE-family HTH domain
MPNIGEIFKKARLDSGLSLKEAAKLSGLTDSKILRIENGVIKEPSPTSVKKLCVLYHIPAVELFIQAQWLDAGDLETYKLAFKGVESLNPEEKDHIQQEINFILRNKEDAR